VTVRINVGCGQKPTAGWKNFDNSPSVWLARIPLLPGLLRLARLLDGPQAEFIEFAKENRIQYADATRPFAFASASVDVVYSSHMIEHLDRHDVDKFIAETYRLLRPGGVIRLAVPDIRRHVASYEEHDDADKFMEATHLSVPRPRTVAQRLRLYSVGFRHHQWMYDGKSLSALLARHGFVDAMAVPAGVTRITSPEPLDLHERQGDSVYVEATKPEHPALKSDPIPG